MSLLALQESKDFQSEQDQDEETMSLCLRIGCHQICQVLECSIECNHVACPCLSFQPQVHGESSEACAGWQWQRLKNDLVRPMTLNTSFKTC